MKPSYNLNTELGRKAAIKEYLLAKPRVDSYSVTYRRYFYADHEYDDYTPEYLKEFTDEQLSIVKELIALCKSEEIDIWEAIDGETEKYAFLQQEVDESSWSLVPEDIDLNAIYHRYKFKIAIFYNGIDTQPKTHEIRISLTDDEYVELIDWKLCHQSSGFNFMRIANPNMYNNLCEKIDHCFSCEGMLYYTPTYAIEITEIEEDAKMIRAKNFSEE